MSEPAERSVLMRTPLFETHRALGAKLVEFGGWEMPVSYRGILEEHRAVRKAVGLFDVSHMGEIEVLGPHAAALCQRLTTNDVRRLADGHVQYTLLCREDGGVVDDVTLYRIGDQRFFFCVNAGNVAKVLAWIQEHAGAATVVDRSEATALLALQGPAAAAVLQPLTPLALAGLKRFRFARSEVAGLPALVSRTGYTGEDGFEVFVDAPRAVALWEALAGAGAEAGLEPIGLGARDTLRLEAALPLYGHELDDQTSPLAAELGRWVQLDGEDFIGRAALLHEQHAGPPRRLVGLALRGPGIARQGHAVSFEGAPVGIVTSGTFAPTLGSAIALAYLASSLAHPGAQVCVDIRGRAVPAEVVPTPFYRRELSLAQRASEPAEPALPSAPAPTEPPAALVPSAQTPAEATGPAPAPDAPPESSSDAPATTPDTHDTDAPATTAPEESKAAAGEARHTSEAPSTDADVSPSDTTTTSSPTDPAPAHASAPDEGES